jgi:DNA-3-methyladenine glycosylase
MEKDASVDSAHSLNARPRWRMTFNDIDWHKVVSHLTLHQRLAGIDFDAPSHEVARCLIGVTLLIDGVGGRIVETEAYDPEDAASHSFGGPTERNAVMFGPSGHAYVYRSYGIHWCLNFVCREAGHGAGVLIRALEPSLGLARMRERRGLEALHLLCAGPGRLGQALGVDRGLNGKALDAPPFVLLAAPAGQPVLEVAEGPRIGISKAVDVPWRFGERGSRFLSKPFAPGRAGA